MKRDSPSAPKRVLVAEDSAPNQIYLRRNLDQLGCTVTVVDDGQQALAAVETSRFDLCILDFYLPGVHGLEIAKVALAQPDPPVVVVCSAGLVQEHATLCEAAGVALVDKPISLSMLATLVGEPQKSSISSGDGPGELLVQLFDRSRVLEMLDSFEHQALELISQIERGTEVVAAAHRLKGSAVVVQAIDFGQLVAEIEQGAQAGFVDPKQVLELRRAFERLSQQLHSLRARLDTPVATT